MHVSFLWNLQNFNCSLLDDKCTIGINLLIASCVNNISSRLASLDLAATVQDRVSSIISIALA